MRVRRSGTGQVTGLDTAQIEHDLDDAIDGDCHAADHQHARGKSANAGVPHRHTGDGEKQERLEDDRPDLTERFGAVVGVGDCHERHERRDQQQRDGYHDLGRRQHIQQACQSVVPDGVHQQPRADACHGHEDRQLQQAEFASRHRMQVVDRRRGQDNSRDTCGRGSEREQHGDGDQREADEQLLAESL